ncbi:histidinol dehydrogenase [Spirochaetia bacterium 38H-sp]|uniref:Histidinol dehydrogenase n=1 Tax=Rarispira pelagica TaxID=3141764 RepID=A0ABU9UA31_9SPIR
MDVNINFWKWSELDAERRRRILRRSEEDISSAIEAVRPIVEAVRLEGDAAVLRYTREFEGAELEPDGLRVSEEEFSRAEAELDKSLKRAIENAVENVRIFHAAQVPSAMEMIEVRPGLVAGERAMPIDSCGLYVPRGRGSFPSMVYMLAVPAKLAGVKRIVMVSPPESDGSINPACLYAAHLCGVDEVYKMGGSQAIAALAYGTESIRPVSMITGPGSAYVAAAKHLVSHIVNTGLPAGPSESVILADSSADAWKVAIDLLIEAEHGADSSALLVTDSVSLAESVRSYLEDCIIRLPEPRQGFVRSVMAGYGGIIVADSMEEAAAIVNDFAPEHLMLHTREPFFTLSMIENAGEILLGENTPFSIANYATGPNAVLPTGGKAKLYSPVSVRDFIKYSSVVYASKEAFENIRDDVIRLAEFENFPAHAAALKNRDKTGKYEL